MKVSPIMCLKSAALLYVDKAHFIYLQRQHIRFQSDNGITAQMATVRCRCGWNRALIRMHQCLYCFEYFCELCGEGHFGKTREQFRQERKDEKLQTNG